MRMEHVYVAAAVILLLNVVAGLIRIMRGPTSADRMLAGQLFGTSGVAILLLLAQAMDMGSLRDVALVLAMLAVVAVIAFVRRVWKPVSAESDLR